MSCCLCHETELRMGNWSSNINRQLHLVLLEPARLGCLVLWSVKARSAHLVCGTLSNAAGYCFKTVVSLVAVWSEGHTTSNCTVVEKTGLEPGRNSSHKTFYIFWKCTHPHTIQNVDEFVSKSEHVWNSVLHHLFINGFPAVNGCRQNESPNSW